MRGLTFIGGIHPNDGKALSKYKPIKDIVPTSDLVYPLSQHIGAMACPIVKKGDRVRVGTKIAEADGYVSVPLHSAVSGVVKEIAPRRNVFGNMADSIVIENDGDYAEENFREHNGIEELSKEEIIDIIREAGIAGMGGAGFPTHVKLSPKDPDKIEYVIVNCAECEPYLTSDYRRMIENPEMIVEGLMVVLRLFDNARGILAIEDNKPDCIRLLKSIVLNLPNISVRVLKTKYPQGAERQLIYAVTKRKVNASMLPADAGCIVNNADTVCAIYTAVFTGMPLISRIITVTGDAILEPGNFCVPIGANYRELIEEAGGLRLSPEKIISGGPMMGMALFDLDFPVTKMSSSLICMAKDEASRYDEGPCINCGRCASVCPGRVLPSRLAVAANNYNEDGFFRLNGMDCCECGCCSYICPAKRPLTQSIKSMRRLLLAKGKNK